MSEILVGSARTEMQAATRNGVTVEMPTAILTVSIDGADRLDVIIPADAIAKRRALYGLDTDEATINAILREHVTRILDLPEDDNDDPRIAKLGGLRSDVTIRQGTEADLPPVVTLVDPKAALAEATGKVTTLGDLKAAILAFARA